MNTIELYVKDNGKIVCVLYDENKSTHYVSFDECLGIIKKVLNISKYIKFCDDNVIFKANQINVLIKSYNNNISIELDEIIKKARKKFITNKKERLRKNKIKRIATFSSTFILSSSLIFLSFSNSTKGSTVNEFDTKNSYEVNDLNISHDDSKNDIYFFDNQKGDVYNNLISYDLYYEDRTYTDKFIETKDNYFNVIKSISEEYGIDPKIMLAIATQESGEHRVDTNTPALGLMQIELSVWDGENVTAFNYKNNKEETFKITKEKLKDLEFNIRVACMIFQNCLKNSNYNLEVAIQMYNYGYGNILKTFKMYYGSTDIDLDDVLNNYDDGWLDYREKINVGDKLYLEHVLSYIEDASNLECISGSERVTFSFNDNVKKL